MPKAIRITQFRYMNNEAWRILMAVEMGMKNHEFVPPDLVHKISRCSRRGSSFLKILKDDLVPHGLLAYETDARKSYSGYRLTNLGYDYLALHALMKSGQVVDLGSMIGAGKESDVYLAVAGDTCGRAMESGDVITNIDTNLPARGEYIVIKFHRLGRTSFRKVKEKREYHQHRTKCSWLYLDRLAASREYNMMQVLYDNGLPVPCPLAYNRNAVVMSLLSNAIPLCKVLPVTLNAEGGAVASSLYNQAIEIFTKITGFGLVHGDFNEFNLLVHGLTEPTDDFPDMSTDNVDSKSHAIPIDNVNLILIDFPQMISRDHRTAQELYERDLNGILNFFSKYLEIEPDSIPPSSLSQVPRTGTLDVELKAPGYPHKCHTTRRMDTTRTNNDSDILVGTVASLDEQLELISSSSDEESCSTSDEETAQSSGVDDSRILSSNDEEFESNADIVSSRSDTNKSVIGHKKASETIISKTDIRERCQREEKKRQQQNLRLRIKRQQRASRKHDGRNDIATEIKLFE